MTFLLSFLMAKSFFCFIFMVVVRRPSDKLLPCTPMMRIRFWNAIKRRRRKSTRCRQKWFNHEACREMFPVSIQFAILLTIRFRKSKFNFPEKHFTSSLWRSPGIDSAVTSLIMRCPGLQIVAVAVHAGATEKATKAEKSCWMNWNLVWSNWFVGEFWICRRIKKF